VAPALRPRRKKGTSAPSDRLCTLLVVEVSVGYTSWTTALWPKDGQYIVPLKDWVRRAERLQLGDTVEVRLTVDV
jgi:hypothetical protein